MLLVLGKFSSTFSRGQLMPCTDLKLLELILTFTLQVSKSLNFNLLPDNLRCFKVDANAVT